MNYGKSKITASIKILLLISALCAGASAQYTEPKPGATKSVKVPAVKEFTLKNGLKVAVVERPGVPLVSAQLLVKAGAEIEMEAKAGLADMTASLLTKGTKSRSANQIAEQIEFLGADLNSGAGWNSTTISVNVMSDKLDQVMAIMADSILNPAFEQAELDLLRSQTLDGLKYNLTQPGFLTNYVASVYSYNEHPSNGTPASINSITRSDIAEFHSENFLPDNAVLILVGDVDLKSATALANTYFSKWKSRKPDRETDNIVLRAPAVTKQVRGEEGETPLIKRILVVDLPGSGQASVSFAKSLEEGRLRCLLTKSGTACEPRSTYFPAITLNSVLGGGYSSRLNQEIRIKRGLSYGAGSSFAWRGFNSNFGTRTQTKNESAAEVAELVAIELKKLTDEDISESELNPRRLVLTGGFGRNLETNAGLANAIFDLYSFELPADNLNSFMDSVMKVSDKQIKQFAAENFNGGDIIIVGDYAKFKDDLAKRFPNIKADVIKADELDISRENLRK